MTSVAYTCKICQQPGTAQAPEEYDEQTHGRWVKMLCHDFCNDRRVERRECEWRIDRACILLRRLESADDEERDEISGRIRVAMESITKRWSRNESLSLGSQAYYWNEEMLDLLMDKPDAWPVIMQGARDFIREQVRINQKPQELYGVESKPTNCRL